jgi:hypothetical protein
MKALTLKKRIVIPYDGYIPLKGVNGPVTVPYMETFENISKLLMGRMPVKEVLKDGTKVDLNLMNYDKENSWNASSTEKKYEAVVPTRDGLNSKKRNKTIIVTDDDVKAASMESLLSRGLAADAKVNPEQTVNVTNAVSKHYESGEANNKSKHNKKKWKNQDEVFDSK